MKNGLIGITLIFNLTGCVRQWYDSPIPVKVDLTIPTATAIPTDTVTLSTQSSKVNMQSQPNNKTTRSTKPHQ